VRACPRLVVYFVLKNSDASRIIQDTPDHKITITD
jgi:hypothetical protein